MRRAQRWSRGSPACGCRPVWTRGSCPSSARAMGSAPSARLLSELPAPEGLEPGEYQQLCLSSVRELIARGYLVGDGWPDEEPGRQAPGRTAGA
jgi:hypothetical protein